MKTYSRLTLAFLLLILVVPQVVADEPPENGKHVEYYENGKKKLEANVKNGMPDGLMTQWYENGKKKLECHYKYGKPDGLMTRWSKNDQKYSEGHLKNGKEDGLWTYWHENGQKNLEGNYKNGKEEGLWAVWDENGNKALEIQFKDGKEVSRKELASHLLRRTGGWGIFNTIGLLLGLILGAVLVWKHRSTRNKNVFVKIILAMFCAIGFSLLFNAFLEILDAVGLLPR